MQLLTRPMLLLSITSPLFSPAAASGLCVSRVPDTIAGAVYELWDKSLHITLSIRKLRTLVLGEAHDGRPCYLV